MVPKSRQVALDAFEAGKGWPKVRREEAEDVDKGGFELQELLGPLRGADGGEVLVAPRVTADLVAVGMHPPDEVGVGARGVGNGGASAVFAVQEEGCLGLSAAVPT